MAKVVQPTRWRRARMDEDLTKLAMEGYKEFMRQQGDEARRRPDDEAGRRQAVRWQNDMDPEEFRRGRQRRPDDEAGRYQTTNQPSRIESPPGFKILAFSEFFFSSNTHRKVLEPIIRDLQDEYIEALAERRTWKSRYVCLRGYASYWSAMWVHLSGSVVRKILTALGVAASS